MLLMYLQGNDSEQDRDGETVSSDTATDWDECMIRKYEADEQIAAD